MNFTITELCKSDVARKNNITNTPQQLQIYDNMLILIADFLQPLRNKLNKPIVITSGYRCEKLNKLVGGVSNSAHKNGSAVDIYVPNMTVNQLFDFICKSGLKWTQLIEEHSKNSTWVHISYDKNNLKCEKLIFKNGTYYKL